MAMPLPLRVINEAYQAVRADAAREYLDLTEKFPGQAKLLSEWLGQGVPEAVQQLENIANKGADAIPDDLRQDVLDAYNKLAQTVADAPPALKPYVDPDGLQALRAELTTQASELMSSGGLGAGGIAAIAAWWASLPFAVVMALVTAGILLSGAGFYLGYRALRGPGHSSNQIATEGTDKAGGCPSYDEKAFGARLKVFDDQIYKINLKSDAEEDAANRCYIHCVSQVEGDQGCRHECYGPALELGNQELAEVKSIHKAKVDYQARLYCCGTKKEKAGDRDWCKAWAQDPGLVE